MIVACPLKGCDWEWDPESTYGPNLVNSPPDLDIDSTMRQAYVSHWRMDHEIVPPPIFRGV